jgi:hypothetical protein
MKTIVAVVIGAIVGNITMLGLIKTDMLGSCAKGEPVIVQKVRFVCERPATNKESEGRG